MHGDASGPMRVVQKRLADKDGYQAVQLGLVEFVKSQRMNKPMTGHFKKANVPPVRLLREVRLQVRTKKQKLATAFWLMALNPANMWMLPA